MVRRQSWSTSISGGAYSHLALGPSISNSSRDSPILVILLCMLLAKDEDLGDAFVQPSVVPSPDPYKGLYLVTIVP